MNTIKLSAPATRQFWEIPVLFEDEHLLALNKPAGLLTSPDHARPDRPSLVELLNRDVARGAAWAVARRISYLVPTHRLDAEIGGVLLLARAKPILSAVASQFGVEKPLKTFVALVHGAPAQETFQVDVKVARDPLRPGVMRWGAANGRKARTHFQVLERFAGCTLLKCQPLTDQPHQVRVHLKSRRFPVLGDAPYGGPSLLLSRLKPGYRLKPNRTERPLVSSPALHLEELHFLHPVTGGMVTIQAPWPKDLIVAVKYLRRYTGAGGIAANGPLAPPPE